MELPRRRVLAAAVTAGSAALAGCSLFDASRFIDGSVATNDVEGVEVVDLTHAFTATPEGRTLAMTARIRNNREDPIAAGTLCATFRVFDEGNEQLGTVDAEMKQEFPADAVRPLSAAYGENTDAIDRYEMTLLPC